MSEAFLKALKWYFMALAGIAGASAFIAANKPGAAVTPWIVVVLGFGIVYIMSYFWREFRGKVLLISVFVFLILTFASSYVAMVLYMLLGVDILSFSDHVVWGLMMLLGIPVMTLAFNYVGDE